MINWVDETPDGSKFKDKKLVFSLRGDKPVHLRVEKEGDTVYLCNQQWGTAKPSKSTYNKDLVTCRNCLRIMKTKK